MASEQFTVSEFRARRIEPSVSNYTAREIDLAGVVCETVVADGADEDVTVLYLHGGGYIRGTAAEYRGITVRLSRALGARVVVPNFRLAPEHPFPIAYDDCSRVYRALVADRSASDTLAVAGDSAGGALAVSVLFDARESTTPMPACVYVLTPYADLLGRSESLSDPRYASAGLSKGRVDWLRATCLTSPHTFPTDPRHSPVYGDLATLPPILIQVGGRDPFHDDGVRLAAKARADGVNVTLTEYAACEHSWLVRSSAEPEPALEQAAQFISHWTRGPACAPAPSPATPDRGLRSDR